jgi:hypothetical protein
MKCVGEAETAKQGGGTVALAVWEQACSCGVRHRLSMAKGRTPAPGAFEAMVSLTTCVKHAMARMRK